MDTVFEYAVDPRLPFLVILVILASSDAKDCDGPRNLFLVAAAFLAVWLVLMLPGRLYCLFVGFRHFITILFVLFCFGILKEHDEFLKKTKSQQQIFKF